jgi:hypothetical protein
MSHIIALFARVKLLRNQAEDSYGSHEEHGVVEL